MDVTNPIQGAAALAAQPAVAEHWAILPDSAFKAAFNSAPAAMSICRPDGSIVETNEAMIHLLGSGPVNLDGTSQWQFAVSGSDRDVRNDVQARQLTTIESRFRRSDGSEFPGRMSISRLELAFPHEWQCSDRSSGTLLLILLEDVSEHRQMEEALRQAEKMEVIGRLAAGIAHDFNNLLTGIFLYSDLLPAELQPGTSERRFVEELQLASEQGSGLTKQLMAVLRKQGSGTGAIAVNDVIAEMERLLRHMIGEQIQLLIALDPAVGCIAAEEAELRQIVLNLVLNARDALDGGRIPAGKIRVSTRIPSAGVIQMSVEDNGCGMTSEIRAHLFEPLFTTKKAGEGTGLGLATVKRVVGELGGKVEVASAPGCGTRIEVTVPAVEHRESSVVCPQVVGNPK